MLRIVICDDEQAFVRQLSCLLEQYRMETGEELRIQICYDGSELVNHYREDTDLIFLDVRMNQMDGLKTAERIRQMDETVGIIFLTSMARYAVEGYRYQALNYIIKPIRYARLKSEMDRWLRKYRRNSTPFLLVANDTGRFKVFLKSIRYIETFQRNLLLHTETENLTSYKSMKQIETELKGHGFVRCHTSYIVNLFFVKGVQKLEIKLISGELIPISQPKRREFMEQLAEYWGDQL